MRKTILLAFIILAAATSSWAGFFGPVAVGALQQQATVIVAATIAQVNEGTTSSTVQLQIVRVIQGQPASNALTATILPGSRPAKGILPPSFIGTTGIWFLSDKGSGYVVQPLVQGLFRASDLFISVPDTSAIVASAGSVGQQLITYQTQAYQSLVSPDPVEDEKLFTSLIYGTGQDAQNAIASLTSSASPRAHAIGLCASIRLGSADAIAQVASELDALRSNPGFSYVLASLSAYPASQDAQAVAAFGNLAAMHSGIPGMDNAVSTALVAIGNGAHLLRSSLSAKTVVAAMVPLLDSDDPSVQIRTARFFAYFALFADANGNIPGTGVTGPFATADTRQFTPSKDSTLSAAQYAGFWKVWWAQNKTKLGY